MDPTQAPMDPAAQAAMLAGLEHFRQTLSTSITYTSCLFTLLCWDYIITLPMEIKHYWRNDWTVSTYLFLFNRYVGIGGMIMVMVMFHAGISAELCKNSAWLEPAFSLLVIVAAEAILVTRVYALWDRAKWVICLFAAVCCVETTISIYAMVGGIPLSIPPQLDIHACIFNGGPSNADRLWLSRLQPIVSDSLLVILTLVRSWQLQRRADGQSVPILRILIRDGLIFYLVVLAVNLLNLIWMKTRSITNNQALHAPLATVITTMAASRLALVTRDPAYIESSTSSQQRSFASRVSKFTGSRNGNGAQQGTGVKTAYPLTNLRKVQKDEMADEERIYSQFDVEVGNAQAEMDKQHVNTRASVQSSTY